MGLAAERKVAAAPMGTAPAAVGLVVGETAAVVQVALVQAGAARETVVMVDVE